LIVKYNKKEYVAVPSFPHLPIESSEIYEFYSQGIRNLTFSVVPYKKLRSFNASIVRKNKIYDFGKLEDIQK
jgi:hypothetical protein